jgi:putative endonuclease
MILRCLREFRGFRKGRDLAAVGGMFAAKQFVYVLRSTVAPTHCYVGLTSDVGTRLAVHNSGGSRHTSLERPWQLVVSLEFANESSAVRFEKYLKSGSGRAFAKRHFV